MRKIMMTAALMALAATLTAGCGDDASAEPEETAAATTPAAPSTVTISVIVETENGLIGHNHDDEICLFAEPEYELQDGAGTIIDVGQWEEGGASVGPSEWAAAGEVESLDPYLCVLSETIVADAADIYVLTVTALRAPLLPNDPPSQPVSGEATFRQDTADSVAIELIED